MALPSPRHSTAETNDSVAPFQLAFPPAFYAGLPQVPPQELGEYIPGKPQIWSNIDYITQVRQPDGSLIPYVVTEKGPFRLPSKPADWNTAMSIKAALDEAFDGFIDIGYYDAFFLFNAWYSSQEKLELARQIAQRYVSVHPESGADSSRYISEVQNRIQQAIRIHCQR